MTLLDFTTLTGRLGLDVLCLLVLAGWLHRRRGAAPEMLLVFTALNIGLFAAVAVIGTGDFPTGIGFGLFGLLSLVRLRSAAFTLKDVSYTFVALVLALVNALPGRDLGVVVGLDLAILLAVWLADSPRGASPASHVLRVTLDRAVTDPDDVRRAVTALLGAPPLTVVVDDVDLVRETTRVSVRQEIEDPWWVRRDAELTEADERVRS